jgi:starch-binding outer membrane protein SusE/F
MKTIQIRYIFLAIASIAISSCTDEEKVFLNSSASVVPAASTSDVVLTKDGEGSDALTINWPEPDYGFDASPTYMIYMYNESGDSLALNNGGASSKTFKTEELNKYLLNLEFEPGVEAPLKFKVESKLTPTRSIISSVIDVTATAYTSFLDLSTTWGVVGSGYNNWGAFPDAPFFTSSTPNVIVSYVTLVNGEIKFRENNDWANNYGDDGGDGTLEAGGANISVTAGTYKISFNTADKTYEIEPYSWGIVGSAYNNWGATPDFNFTYDDATDQWRALVKLSDGEFKIRKNSDWGVNYGDDGADGTLDAGGANIAATAGKYQITFNEKDLTIEVVPIPSIWGLVGSAYNNWGATPDAQFNRDWRNEGVWVLKSVHLVAGEFKFRDANDWGTNYGDDGGDGTLQSGGANITVAQEGYYDITLDFSDPENPTYTMVKL